VKSLMSLLKILLDESGSRCCTSTDRDWKTISDRVEHEGISFLTITLPQFGKDLQKGLEQGEVDSSLFAGFKRRGGLPVFLQGFLRRVFDASGTIRHEPDIAAIHSLRQICFVFEKVALDCSDERYRKAMKGYVSCENDIRDADLQRPLGHYKDLSIAFAMLFGNSIDRLNRELLEARYDRFLPKHGPGATADGLVGNQKFKQSVWTSRLDAALPSGEFLLPNWRYSELLSRIDVVEPGTEQPVRVISVPKTLKTPRIIAIEPTAMQYAQQSILRALLDVWKEDKFLANYVTLEDQTPNQRMARLGSEDGSLATIDLSEASDRVSNQLVENLLAPWPSFAEAVAASRSTKADVPGHGEIHLAKFASMGSALTFPIEVMVFISIIFMTMRQADTTTTWDKLKLKLVSTTRAYGDDLIVPVDLVRDVISNLESFGFRVNGDKTFYNGSFRESCGKDYYAGDDVSVVRMRRMLPTSRRDASEIVAMVSFRNQLYYAGYWTTCQWLDEKLRSLLQGRYPLLDATSPGLGRHTFLSLDSVGKVRGRYQRQEILAYVPYSPIPKNGIDDVPALMKCLITGENPDVKHLERSGRPKSTSIKLRMVPVR
jgi:hypothetical protein